MLFLTHWPDGNYRVGGYAQGIYRVVQQAGGDVLVPGPTQDVPDRTEPAMSMPLAAGTPLEALAHRLSQPAENP